MKLKRTTLVIVSIILITLLSVACSKSPTAAPAETQYPSATQETVPVVQQSAVATKQAPTVPDDVPIMPDEYEIQVPNQLNITYKVNAQIQDVVDFYEQALPGYGWDQVNNPDSVVGYSAQMARSKSNGDRLTFSIQYNPIGEFTIVQIYITRAP